MIYFYYRVQRQVQLKYIRLKIYNLLTFSFKYSNVPKQNGTEKQIRNLQGYFNKLIKYQLDRSAIQSIPNDTYQLLRGDMNCLMKRLSINKTEDAGQFCHKVIDSVSTILRCDMFQLQRKSAICFQNRTKSFQLTAKCTLDSSISACKGETKIFSRFHWQKKWNDSLSVVQVTILMRHGETLKTSRWQYVEYCSDSKFLLQKDGTI